MKKVLFLVHCEEMFRDFFPGELYPYRLRQSATARKYDRVILLDSDVGGRGPNGNWGIIQELNDLNLETWTWGWGYEQGQWYDPLPDEACCSSCGKYGDLDPDGEGWSCPNCGCYWSGNTQYWVIESSGHEYTWVPAELREEIDYFEDSQIFVGGGFYGECLADWESVLDYMGLNYKLVGGLVYGC